MIEISPEFFGKLVAADIKPETLNAAILGEDQKPKISRQEAGRVYCTYATQGISFIFESDGLATVQFFAPGASSSIEGYKGHLPKGLDFTNTFDQTLLKCGSVHSMNEGDNTSMTIFKISPWIKFDIGICMLHVAFSDDKSTTKIVSLSRHEH